MQLDRVSDRARSGQKLPRLLGDESASKRTKTFDGSRMNFFLLEDPAKPADFARFSAVGTWREGGACKACGERTAELVEPLRIEWNEGTDRIGDFSWGGYNTIVLDRAKNVLQRHGFEARFGIVEVKPPEGQARQPRVPFPYQGPQLHWLIPSVRLPLDLVVSKIELKSECPSCGIKRYAFRRDHLAIRRDDWRGEQIFMIEQFRPSRATFVTETALDVLAKAELTNLSSRLAGRIE